MAQLTPAPPRARAPGRHGRELPARLAPVHRRLTTSAWLLPLLLGTVYGLWAAQMDRAGPAGHTRYAGPITTGDVLLGVLSGLVVAVLAFLLHRIGPRLRREPRALAWGAFAGVTLGWLYSLTHASVFRTVVVALATAAGVLAMTLYRYHTTGRR